MIRVGIGGWTYAPWRGTFFPKGLAHAKELHFASRALSAIEINGTYYSTMKPQSFQKWHDETPDDFVFSVKASRFSTNRKELASAKDSIDRFISSGLSALGDKLGPILWQFAPTKKFDAEDFEAFLALLPKSLERRTLRHALEVRTDTFVCEEFIALARKYNAAIVLADSDKYPLIADVAADFLYLRLQRSSEKYEWGYSPAAIKSWAERAQAWSKGSAPKDLKTLAKPAKAAKSRDVFVFMIGGDKIRAPAAAQALLKQLSRA